MYVCVGGREGRGKGGMGRLINFCVRGAISPDGTARNSGHQSRRAVLVLPTKFAPCPVGTLQLTRPAEQQRSDSELQKDSGDEGGGGGGGPVCGGREEGGGALRVFS